MIRRALLSAILLATSGLPACAQHQVLPDFQADPSARVFHGRVYVYPSHDIAGSKDWDMVDWHVFSTADMVHWKDHGVIFSLKDITWAKKYAWAPDCIERNGKYYFYFPADSQIGVAISSSPTGHFKDALGKPLISRDEVPGIRVFDPNIFIDDDGQAYLYFGNSRDHLAVVKLKKDMVTRDGPIQVLDVKNYHEGIWVHKFQGLYYFSYPSYRGDLIANLMEYSVARTPLGPFEYKGVILENRSRNVHGSIVEFKGKWWLFYHVAGPSPYERRVCLAQLHYNPDGSIAPVTMTDEPILKRLHSK
ncbi:MAG TPA: family 43 glycosylhydrolase [Acidobacteriaceae bacterium]|nr:family 43 glycosylhydrolase [Acidobacteriaceae bacterium]